MINKLNKWFYKPAKWWQFWLPQSGMEGGAILGLILSVIGIIILGDKWI